jgi:hypothetical protein
MEQPARIAHPVRLDDLIDAIKGVHTEALDQLTDAIPAAEHRDGCSGTATVAWCPTWC